VAVRSYDISQKVHQRIQTYTFAQKMMAVVFPRLWKDEHNGPPEITDKAIFVQYIWGLNVLCAFKELMYCLLHHAE
jgi:hypothetical protein